MYWYFNILYILFLDLAVDTSTLFQTFYIGYYNIKCFNIADIACIMAALNCDSNWLSGNQFPSDH